MKKLFAIFAVLVLILISAVVTTVSAEQTVTFKDLEGKWEGTVQKFSPSYWSGSATLVFSKNATGKMIVSFNDNYKRAEAEITSLKNNTIYATSENSWSFELTVKRNDGGQLEIKGDYDNRTPGNKTSGSLLRFKKVQ
jgi:peptidoglycan hydrolase CwlO-like protein